MAGTHRYRVGAPLVTSSSPVTICISLVPLRFFPQIPFVVFFPSNLPYWKTTVEFGTKSCGVALPTYCWLSGVIHRLRVLWGSCLPWQLIARMGGRNRSAASSDFHFQSFPEGMGHLLKCGQLDVIRMVLDP